MFRRLTLTEVDTQILSALENKALPFRQLRAALPWLDSRSLRRRLVLLMDAGYARVDADSRLQLTRLAKHYLDPQFGAEQNCVEPELTAAQGVQ